MAADRPRGLSVENLESRLNLSSLGGLAVPQALSVVTAQERATVVKTAVTSLTDFLKQYREAGPGQRGLHGGAPGGMQGAGKPSSGTATGVAAPTALSASATTSAVSLKWTDKSTNESGFKVYKSADGVNFALAATLGKGKSSYTDTLVAPGANYSYYVVAYNSTAVSAASNTVTKSLAQVTPPMAPTAFATTDVAATSVSLGWTDGAGNEAGYRVYRSTDGASFTMVGDLGANATAFTDSGLAGETGYTYKVSAWNSGGEVFSGSALAVTTLKAADPNQTPGNFTTVPVTVSTPWRVSFSELKIEGTTGNDSIVVTQANGVLTVVANGQTTQYAGNFGDIMISGGAGDDAITVDASVNIGTLMYGGDGNNVLKNLTQGKATIVSIGRGSNVVTGNGNNTAYWVNTGDVVNASTAEVNLGGVNKVGNFYQPWSTSATNADYISRDLYGQNLREPGDAGGVVRLTANSFFGTGPTMNDINQTSLADCYFLAPLSSLAYSSPERLTNMAVDLGDGTYAFRFYRSGVVNYVRVDGDLSAGGWNGLANQMPGANGNLWGSLYEKAYAYFRNGANTYSSLNWGYHNQTYTDLGLRNSALAVSSTDTTLLNTITTSLGNHQALSAGTNAGVTSGAPLIGSHVYSILGAWKDASGTLMIQLRNPWGIDGAGWDGADDAVVTVSSSVFRANFGSIAYTT